jgi:hypothetical protein
MRQSALSFTLHRYYEKLADSSFSRKRLEDLVMQTPWAILLCKFKDDASEPYTKQLFEELFTISGAGKFNMVDFFRDMSHGVLDLSGSKVFGWFTLDKNRSEYSGSNANQQGREELIAWARQKAIDNNVDLNSFFSVVVCMNVPTDVFGRADVGVACDDARVRSPLGDSMTNLSPSVVGHMMGNVYGLDHSREDGSTEDCQDEWDIMSTVNAALIAEHPYFTDQQDRIGRSVFRMGPGLNAANMWSRGWLDLSRVWTAGADEYGATVHLRPLHRRDLPGYLAARVGQYFFELRVPELWDYRIAQEVVLVHDFFNGNSYIHTDKSGSNQGLLAGDEFEVGDPNDTLGPLIRVKVRSIDADARTATLKVFRRQDRRPVAGPAQILGGVASDGGGWVIVGPTIRKIPPRSPLLRMLEHMVALQESESISHGATRDLLRRDALEGVRALANAELERMLSYRSPAPPRLEQTPDSDQV